ncbi:odorant receptor 13a [Lasius niger]|uniref:Odorant receptor 13a n=1 Tax=Lasius niger TaxID=67767 RepID=A0A0J7L2U6_LASNI|nr:odorant receptor 13a [Lasius niger]
MIAEDWLRPKSDEERKVMIRCARIPRIIIICGFVSMFASFILLFILPCLGITIRYITNVTDPGKPLPLQTYYPYDTDTSPYFELTFLAQGVTLMVSAMGYTAIDSLFGLLVFHVCGQLMNLKDRLTDKKDPNFDRVLADVVKDHVRLIRFRTQCLFPA